MHYCLKYGRRYFFFQKLSQGDSKGDDCMKFTIVGKNIEVTPGLRSAVEEKIGKLEKYFTPDTNANVTLNVDKERHKIEVTIPVKGKIIRAEQVSNDKKEYIESDYMDDEDISIERMKKFDPKPMYAEDACVQMELLGHNFFVFVNAETDQVNVVYKRKGNTYGLIEPEV